MRYYKYDLWMHDSEKEWDENSLKYNAYFETIKSNFTEDFLKIYYDTCGFHDYKIRTMLMIDDNTFILELFKKEKQICIEYKNVSRLVFSLNSNKISANMQTSEYLEWGYDEFHKENDDLFTHSVITACGLEFIVSFKTISVTRRQEDRGRGKQGTVLCLE